MEHPDTSHLHVSSPGWQLLGELELAANPDTEPTVGKWLSVMLSPLNLRAEFMNKVLKSAQEATQRALPAEAVIKFDHLHLLVFVPLEHGSKGGTWGFFRIEKVEHAAVGNKEPDHAIEFYLYLDGQ